MENNKNHAGYVGQLTETLKAEKMSEIDFDLMIAKLSEIEPQIRQLASTREQLSLLRNDFIGRIGGMTKAIAAASRRHDNWSEALAQIEALDEMSAEELVDQYRKVSARFRDSFPSSFYPGAGQATRPTRG